ncbi:beta-2-microglobulin [Pagrus major]|uniref:beta-2-microglobulin n=1 Tax=Pagrus major TaxID=143350 RepID=UPI003CC8A471
MRIVLCLAALAAVYCSDDAKYTPPKVQVYTAGPAQFGEKNTLICHVSGFHPPDITIQLMKEGEELSNANQTDLAFKPDWHFHLTKNVAFTPTRGQKYSCKVTHGRNMKEYAWVPNM